MSTGNRAVLLGSTPDLRFEMVLDYAAKVLGGPGAAKAWIATPDQRVRQGGAAVAQACRTPEGFREAMGLLHRLRVTGSLQQWR